MCVELIAVDVDRHLLGHALLVGGEEVELLLEDVVHTLELGTLANGPRQWAHMDLQLLLELVEQVEGVASLAVHLVEEDDDGCVAHAAHLHELTCLRLHTLGRVDHDDGRVDGCERAVGVLGEVLVTRCVEDVHLVGFALLSLGQVVELHDRRRHRDAALLLNVHPVGCGGLAYLVVLHGSGHLYLSSKEQELLGECGLTGVGV